MKARNKNEVFLLKNISFLSMILDVDLFLIQAVTIHIGKLEKT